MIIYPKLVVEIDGAPADYVLTVTLAEARSLKQAVRRAFPNRDFGALDYHFHTDLGSVDD